MISFRHVIYGAIYHSIASVLNRSKTHLWKCHPLPNWPSCEFKLNDAMSRGMECLTYNQSHEIYQMSVVDRAHAKMHSRDAKRMQNTFFSSALHLIGTGFGLAVEMLFFISFCIVLSSLAVAWICMQPNASWCTVHMADSHQHTPAGQHNKWIYLKNIFSTASIWVCARTHKLRGDRINRETGLCELNFHFHWSGAGTCRGKNVKKKKEKVEQKKKPILTSESTSLSAE